MNKMRPELSKKNPYWISKYRYYELKYFCLQYYEWKQKYYELEMTQQYGSCICPISRTNSIRDKTGDTAIKMADIKRKMELIEQTCIMADSELYDYIFQGVTCGYGYTYLQTVLQIPCSKDTYYDRYHKFFYILSKKC